MSTNNITGDSLRTKPASKEYLSNYDLIFAKNKESKPIADSQKEVKQNDGKSKM